MNFRSIPMMLILLIFNLSYAEVISIEGTVEDVTSREPLPYANIAIAGTDRGTISNLNGKYSLEIDETENILIVSYIGYKTDTIIVDVDIEGNSIILPITLIPEPILIREVSVIAGYNYAEELLINAYERVRQESDNLRYRQAFYRQYTAVDSAYILVWEMFYDLLADKNGIVEHSIRQGREASKISDRKDLSWLNDNFSFFTMVASKATQRKESILSFLPLIRRLAILMPIRINPGKYFDCRIEGYRIQDGRSVAIIGVEPRVEYDRPIMSGPIEIFEDDYQILRYELKASHQDLNNVFRIPRIGPFIGLELYLKDTEFKFIMANRQVAEHVWGLDRIEVDVIFHERSNVLADHDRFIHYHSVMLLYDFGNEDRYSGISNRDRQSDRITIREELEYDPDFWKKNSTIMDEVPMEEEIVQFFQEHAFRGNALPGGVND